MGNNDCIFCVAGPMEPPLMWSLQLCFTSLTKPWPYASLCYYTNQAWHSGTIPTRPGTQEDRCQGSRHWEFLASLFAEHNMPCVLTQIKSLWLRHVKALYPEEVQDEAAAGASWACAEVCGGQGAVRARATTQPPTQADLPKAWEIVVVYKDAVGCSALPAGQAVPTCLLTLAKLHVLVLTSFIKLIKLLQNLMKLLPNHTINWFQMS